MLVFSKWLTPNSSKNICGQKISNPTTEIVFFAIGIRQCSRLIIKHRGIVNWRMFFISDFSKETCLGIYQRILYQWCSKRFRSILDRSRWRSGERSLYDWLFHSNKYGSSACIFRYYNSKWSSSIKNLHWKTTRCKLLDSIVQTLVFLAIQLAIFNFW